MGQKRERAMAGSTDGQAGNLHDAGGWTIGPTSKNCKKTYEKKLQHICQFWLKLKI